MPHATPLTAPPIPQPPPAAVTVEPWPSERPLLILVACAAALLWLLLAVSIIGFVYVALIAVVLFFVHLGFVTHLRGSAVRLGPRQFPELYARVVTLARQAGLAQVPEVYLLESGGSLNALATRFFRSRMVVLFSDLLEACGDDQAARDMVIGHELGHLKERHLDWHLFLLPGMLVPFLGAAYSRAREHTCDRWGAALCGSPAAAVRGMAILAAGGTFGPRVDLSAYAEQERDLDTGWMTLGRWLDPYPPLSVRVSALEPQYLQGVTLPNNGPLRAIGILFAFLLLPLGGAGIAAAVLVPTLSRVMAAAAPAEPAAFSPWGEAGAEEPAPRLVPPGEAEEVARTQVAADFDRLQVAITTWAAANGRLPADDEVLGLWSELGDGPFPTDPFDGSYYGYYLEAADVAILYSSGPDGEAATEDDIERRLPLGS
jgi:Zn-dependent protease with chaperone function